VIMILAPVRQLIEAMANRRLIAQLAHRASTDSLTGLLNRVEFRDELNGVLGCEDPAGGGMAILYIDLDKFKTINDRYGHAAGDRVLNVIATRLAGAVRPTDRVGRLGGDEFAVLVSPAPNRDQVGDLARRVQERFLEPVAFGADRITLSASIGAAVAHPGDGAEDVLRVADVALYAAKARGRGAFEIYNDVIHGDALSRMWLEADMPDSLARGEFTVLYQPTVRSASGTISGAEALVRWDHPTRGRISPLDFIPVAEASGFIVELGKLEPAQGTE
jgi:diguanylate cyclase (GGDEF)-like protein